MSEQTNPIISFKNFSFQYRAQKKPTLHDINLDIYPGERVLIAGPSGSGKSTLAACINGLNPFSNPGECTGSLTVDGVDAPNSSIFELSAHVGTVLQDPDGQFIGLTVGEDIAFALENSCVPQKEMHEITRHAAELVGIENRLDHAPHELSGGQKQRVSLAGVMVDQVKILMFDEPLASLDPATGKQAIELIDEIQHKTDTTVLIIEHRLEDVLWRNVDRIILVNEGTILADLRPDELLATHMLAENGIRALYVPAENAAEAAEAIGIGLQAFCIPGSVADDRKVGIGHGNLAAMLLREETKCFAFLAGHESFAAAEGAIKIAAKADKVRKEPLRCILNGLGKDAAQIISRINGFTYVQTQFDYFTGELKVVREIAYSDGPRAKVKCYGADDVREGVAIMWKEGVDVSITGNSTNPTRFQHPVAGTYKKERVLAGKPYFSVASGGGTGRTLHPDNMAAGPASYGMTDTMGRMHSDAQFAGSSSVPAHVEMMGFLGIGNNPMVGCTVACAVDVAQALGK